MRHSLHTHYRVLAKPILALFLLCHCAEVLGTVSANSASRENRETTYRLYLDADMSNQRAAGQSIALGVKSALTHLAHRLSGVPVELTILDHRGNTARSKNNIAKAAADPACIAIIGGMHSPPLLAHRELINRQQVLTLVPWAAATGITRPEHGENWIFRLSLDDRYAGAKLIAHTVNDQHYRRPFLLLENTGWGRANEITMKSSLRASTADLAGLAFFNWGIRRNEALLLLNQAREAEADVIVMVANTPEGLSLLGAMASLPANLRLPVRSHWGITGGDFFNRMGHAQLSQIDLEFLQTRSRMYEEPDHIVVQQALEAAAQVQDSANFTHDDIPAPTGFTHAYDLILLLHAAATQATLTGHAPNDKHAIKRALERLQHPVEGLVKTYYQPFSDYREIGSDAHEALGPDNLRMGRYDASGRIQLLTLPRGEQP